MEVIAANVRELIDNSFNEGHSPLGAVWRGLSEATKQINPSRDGGRPLLDTGRLRNSITTRVEQRRMVFGSNVEYAAAQNFGNPDNRVFGGPAGPIPARPFLPVANNRLAPEDFWDRQKQILRNWIQSGRISE